MKGLLITTDFAPQAGGLVTWYTRLCSAIPDRVIVLAPRMAKMSPDDNSRPYRVVRCWTPVSANPIARLLQVLIFVFHTGKLLRREKITAIHIGQLHLGIIGWTFHRMCGLRYVLYLHGGELAWYLRFRLVKSAVGAIIRYASCVVMNSEFTRSHYAAMDMTHPQTEVLTASVDVKRFHPDVDPSPTRTRFELNGANVILTVGRLVERKGHDIVIAALSKLPSNLGDVRYIIAGTGPEQHRLRQLAHDLGCADRVIFAGRVPDEDLPQLYAACNVFVMPSRALAKRDGIEGFGIVFLEAGACGKPVVGGRSGGVVEAILENETGILVDPTDPEELALTLTHLFCHPDDAQKLGKRGRQRVERLAATWETSVRRIWESFAGEP